LISFQERNMRKTTTFTVALAALLLAPAADAKPKSFDAGMQAILAEYDKIHAVFIEDKADGAAAAAARIEKLARQLPAPEAKGKKGKALGKVAGKLAKHAAVMKGKKELKALREAYKKLSRPMVLWATLTDPAGIKIVYCEMEKGSWLQRQKGVRNPYHGTSMLYCGQFVKKKKKK